MVTKLPPAVVPSKKVKRSLRTTLFLEAFSLLAITVVMTAVTAFFLAEHELKLRTISGLQSAVQGRESLLESTIARQREQLGILAHDAVLSHLPSVTGLVGFQELVKVDLSGHSTHVAGESKNMTANKELLGIAAATDHTIFEPIFTAGGWVSYAIIAPQISVKGIHTGTFIAVFDTKDLLSRMFATEHLGQSAEVLLAAAHADGLTILHGDGQGGAVPVRTSDAHQGSFVLRALADQQGVEDTNDYAGIPVVAAYRTLPTIGWTVIVEVDESEITAPIVQLALDLAGIGLVLVSLLSLSMFILSERIIGPLEQLTAKLNGLETKRWKFKQTIFTGNELEIVDHAAADLTERLRRVYDHLEDIVRERTQALVAQNAQSAAILENVDYGLLMTNDKGVIVYMNRAGELLSGWEGKDLIGQSGVDVIRIVDKRGVGLDDPTHPVRIALAKKERFNPTMDPEFSLLRKDGTRTALHIRVTPILRGKQCLGAVAVFYDTTEERRIDHMKSEFISLVSHQLRTPLTSMRWYLEMLLGEDGGALTPDQHEYVEEVATSNARMVHLVNALLNVSRLELGKMQLNPETVDIRKLLAEIADSFKLEMKRRHMTLDVALHGETGVRTDRGLLQLIIENLISNAIKYGKESTPVVITVTIDEKAENVLVSVKDQGIGIPENQRSQIFQKMFRGTNARASDTDGNGLGLYISRIAADTIGATLAYDTKEGEGTEFRVTLPLAKEEPKS